jgi:cytochrome c-type biogenesis protein
MSASAQASFAFGVGVATFFSPCVYALLPGYVSFYVASVEGETAPLAGALSHGLAAGVGAIGTFLLLSGVAVGATEVFEAVLPVLEPLIGVGLVLLGGLVLWKGALALSIPLPSRRASIFGFGMFGAVYALAATACVLPLFLSVAFLSFGLSLAGTALFFGAYVAGFVLFLLAATVAVAVGQEAFLERFRSRSRLLTRVAGVVLVGAGLLQLYIAVAVAPLQAL